MKAITLWQPWALWVALGLKPIETRLHDRFRCLSGQRIAIHAAGRFNKSDLFWSLESARKYLSADDWVRVPGNDWEYPLGRILCTALVAEARWLTDADSRAALIDCGTVRRFGLVLTDIERLSPPVKCSGNQGIWEWAPEVRP